jgi:outer membrane protein TolC
LRYAEAEKKGLIATYEKTIQSAFKDVADALARRQTLDEQLDAQREYVAAEQKTLDIAQRQYQAGTGDYLSVLTAQRSLWSAQEGLISLQQTDLENRVTLWQSLGVAWGDFPLTLTVCPKGRGDRLTAAIRECAPAPAGITPFYRRVSGHGETH